VPKGLKCALSEKPCHECELNPDCVMYGERYVLQEQLKRLSKSIGDTSTMIRAILMR